MKEAIQKAIEGGWKPHTMRSFDGLECLKYEEVREDPLFWQALGKALGWRNEGAYSFREHFYKDEYGYHEYTEQAWLYQMHRFIDHLAEGKDAENFFTTLLAPQGN